MSNTKKSEGSNRFADTVTVDTLIEAGAHYGHQTDRWNPKFRQFIYGERNGIHIIDLDMSVTLWAKARKFIVDRVSQGANILFVGTKQQAKGIIAEEARRCEAFHCASRWLGGTLTNFQTIKNSIARMRKLEDFLKKADEPDSTLKINKREKLELSRELKKLDEVLGGIKEMRSPPDLLFVVDTVKEKISIQEARRLQIPIIAIVDTNSDPDDVEFPIPANDDAVRAVKLYTAAIADAVLEGKAIYKARFAASEEAKRQKGDTPAVAPGAAAPSAVPTAEAANATSAM